MSKKKNLLLEEADGNNSGELSLKINESFAKIYDESKRRQEIGQLEDKYRAKLQKKGILGKVDERRHDNEAEEAASSDYSEDSESAEEEDHFGELVTPAVDAQILKTLSEIRSRSDCIYDPSTKFFDESELNKINEEWNKKQMKKQQTTSATKSSAHYIDTKPSYSIKDYQRDRILNGRELEEAEAEVDGDFGQERSSEAFGQRQEQIPYAQEQENLRQEMRAAFNDDEEEAETDEEDFSQSLLQKRVKGEEEIAREEEEYRNFLLENLSTSANAKESMAEWLKYRQGFAGADEVAAQAAKSKKQLNDDEFLIDFVLNKGWVDKQETRLASYDQIVNEDINDEEALEKADEYEMNLNFRFEQEGGAQIQTFSREIEGSMRREESKRKVQRQSAIERKGQEKLQKTEELKRLKNLKIQEIQAKLEKIKKVAAVQNLEAEDVLEDLEGDFDPIKHDKLMQKLARAEEEEDEGKPEFSSESEFDDFGNEEDDVVKGVAIKKATKAVKKALKKQEKKSSKSSESCTSQDPQHQHLSQYLDEVYKLDYEDLIAGEIPCRFKYQQVDANDFGLSIDDVLNTDDNLLNQYFSIKKLAPYRPWDRQQRDIEKYATKGRLRKLRHSFKFENKKAKHEE